MRYISLIILSVILTGCAHSQTTEIVSLTDTNKNAEHSLATSEVEYIAKEANGKTLCRTEEDADVSKCIVSGYNNIYYFPGFGLEIIARNWGKLGEDLFTVKNNIIKVQDRYEAQYYMSGGNIIQSPDSFQEGGELIYVFNGLSGIVKFLDENIGEAKVKYKNTDSGKPYKDFLEYLLMPREKDSGLIQWGSIYKMDNRFSSFLGVEGGFSALILSNLNKTKFYIVVQKVPCTGGTCDPFHMLSAY